MSNHLANETSPYLLQHRDNPVDWYPWGTEAFSRAQAENKPIFLSIGYAACHWCHVMAHESFEDPATADYLNDHFVSIKVDREERPDLDDIYMQAVVMLTGRGGWPMSVFLTPDLQPFYGGTYFPPQPRYNMPSFMNVLQSIHEAWVDRPADIHKGAQSITSAVQAQQTTPTADAALPDLAQVTGSLFDSYDWQKGGWGRAPKFPQPMVLQFLAQRAQLGEDRALRLMEDLLDKMAQGGMYDLVGGGFHRYSTDADWLVPHFEKMLYDNAQLALTYLTGYQLTGNIFYRTIAVQTLEFVQRELTNPEGGFIASLDADTPEGEGRFYAWEKKELQAILGAEDFQLFDQLFEISDQGNFEDRLNLIRYRQIPDKTTAPDGYQDRIELLLGKLREVRNQRPRPFKDEKVITEWNAYTILAFARAGAALQRQDFTTTAHKATRFILANLQPYPGLIHRTWAVGKASHPGTLADYSAMILALHTIYELDFSPEIYQQMTSFFHTLKDQFSSDSALFYDTAEDVSHLITRPRNLQDNATPSGNALTARVHWVMGNYEHNLTMLDHFMQMLAPVGSLMAQHPTSFGYWLQSSDLAQNSSQQIALISQQGLDTLEPFLKPYHAAFRPRSIIASRYHGLDGSLPPLLADRQPVDGLPSAYVCQDFSCQQPVTDPQRFLNLLR